MAYELFDKKYTLQELSIMPYKELLYKIKQEEEFQKKMNTKLKK